MARTNYTEVTHKLVDPAAKADAAYTLNDKLAQSSYAQAQDDVYTTDRMLTGEPNQGLLDGLTRVPGAGTNWGLWSRLASDAAGAFGVNPALTALFDDLHTSIGVTFAFCGDTTPQQVTITWYQGTTQLATQTFTVSGFTFFAGRLVADFNKVVVEFIGTKIPQRHLKIAEIDYGAIRVWGKDNVLAARILEEVDPTSAEISNNKMTLRVYDPDEGFNILNPTGASIALKQKQELLVVEYLNGAPIRMGDFYLDTWRCQSATTAEFEAYDPTFLFETIPYRMPAMLTGATAGVVLAGIFAAAGWTRYTIAADIASEPMYGYVSAVSVREALHMACFALRAACVPARTGGLEIKRLPSAAAALPIEKSRKQGKTEITQNPLINSVAVTAYAFTQAAAATQLYSASLTPGAYDIALTSPATALTITGGTITASGPTFAQINVTAPGTVTISGKVYTPQTSVVTYESPALTPNTRSQAFVENNYLVHAGNAAALAQHLYEDYQRRIVQKFALALEAETAGDNTDVDTVLGARQTGMITSLDIDLSKGFKADVEVRG